MTGSKKAAKEYSEEQSRNMAKQLKWAGTDDELTKGLEMLHKRMISRKSEVTHEPTTNGTKTPDALGHRGRD